MHREGEKDKKNEMKEKKREKEPTNNFVGNDFINEAKKKVRGRGRKG